MKLAMHYYCIASVIVLGRISTVWGGCLPDTKDFDEDLASIFSFENELDKLNDFNFG